MNIATVNAGVSGLEMMEKALKFSEVIAQSDIIPSHYKGKPANVFIAVQSALRMNLDPMQEMLPILNWSSPCEEVHL